MAGHNHPIMAGVFVAAIVGGILYGILNVAGKPVKTVASHDRPVAAPADDGSPPLDPVRAQILEAVMLGEDGQLDMAALKLTNVVAEHPDNIEAVFNLGVALTGLDRVDEADKMFAQVLKLDPRDYEAMAERASIRVEQKKIDEAVGFASAIPAGAARFDLRLEHDPRWVAVKSDPRVAELRKKHGLGSATSTKSHVPSN